MNVYAIDFDGIISGEDYSPIWPNIERINALFENPDNFIVIYTARSRTLYEATFNKLTEFGVKFHALVMEKMRATAYIDDKSEFWEL